MGNIFGKKMEENSTTTEEHVDVHTTEQTHVAQETQALEETPAAEEKVEINSLEVGITLLFLCSITEGNPGAHTVMHQLMTAGYEPEFLNDFCKKIIEHKITGSRLWYVYKNECFKDIDELTSKDLTEFNDKYFYEKYEKLN